MSNNSYGGFKYVETLAKENNIELYGDGVEVDGRNTVTLCTVHSQDTKKLFNLLRRTYSDIIMDGCMITIRRETMNIYKYTYTYNLIDSYKQPTNSEEWLDCPVCHSKPLVWIFDNGRHTGCKCHNHTYDHRDIQAESIMEYYRRNGNSLVGFDDNELLSNWNHWVLTGELLYIYKPSTN